MYLQVQLARSQNKCSSGNLKVCITESPLTSLRSLREGFVKTHTRTHTNNTLINCEKREKFRAFKSQHGLFLIFHL